MRGVAFGNVKGKVVRTYNYKRGIAVDHRTGVTLPLKATLAGNLAAFIEAMRRRITK